MSLVADFLGALEEHSADDIRRFLEDGFSATAPIHGRRPIDELIAGYLRSVRFAECLRVLMQHGASIDDPLLEAVLLDDAVALGKHLSSEGASALSRKLLVPCAFTSLVGVSPLHVCAEFGSIRCAQALVSAGADVNQLAAVDADGFGGQTPIFHAVNSIFNYGRPVLELLVDAGADLTVRLKGLRWGVDQEWETLLLDVTPLSYAQCGLYAQFHRREHDVYSNLAYLYQARYGTTLELRNVPNKYLAPRAS